MASRLRETVSYQSCETANSCLLTPKFLFHFSDLHTHTHTHRRSQSGANFSLTVSTFDGFQPWSTNTSFGQKSRQKGERQAACSRDWQVQWSSDCAATAGGITKDGKLVKPTLRQQDTVMTTNHRILSLEGEKGFRCFDSH